MVHQVLLLGAGFVTKPTAVELDKAGVKVTVGKQIYLNHYFDLRSLYKCNQDTDLQ